MNFLASILVFAFALPAFAGVTSFKCELAALPGEKFSFQISDLGGQDTDFVHEDADDGYSPIFKTTSKNRTIESMLGSLEGQGGDLRVESDRLFFFGDAAGIDFVRFYLFKKSGYKAGYVRWDFAGEPGYSKVSCQVK
ncbi:MAG: hypothetical protein V4760_03585 [Bdellovibrionota bacterium]